jgi:hypothetical protein
MTTVPWLRRLVAGLSLRGPGLNLRQVNVGFVVDTVTLDRFLSQHFSFPLPVPFCQWPPPPPTPPNLTRGIWWRPNNKNNAVTFTASYGQVYEVVLRHRVNFVIKCDITGLHLGLQTNSQCSALLLTHILFWTQNPHPVARPPHHKWAWLHCSLVCSR